MTEEKNRKIKDKDLDKLHGGFSWGQTQQDVPHVTEGEPKPRRDGFTPPLGSDKGS